MPHATPASCAVTTRPPPPPADRPRLRLDPPARWSQSRVPGRGTAPAIVPSRRTARAKPWPPRSRPPPFPPVRAARQSQEPSAANWIDDAHGNHHHRRPAKSPARPPAANGRNTRRAPRYDRSPARSAHQVKSGSSRPARPRTTPRTTPSAAAAALPPRPRNRAAPSHRPAHPGQRHTRRNRLAQSDPIAVCPAKRRRE